MQDFTTLFLHLTSLSFTGTVDTVFVRISGFIALSSLGFAPWSCIALDLGYSACECGRGVCEMTECSPGPGRVV